MIGISSSIPMYISDVYGNGGNFPTRPEQIDFDLLFQVVANQWRLYGISISTPQAPSAGR
jgi:hypothetical protein